MTAAARTLEPVVEAEVPQWIRDPGESGFTIADLHALPDEGPRYELIDGSIIVSPSATGGHNVIARWLAQILEEAAPTEDWFVSTDQSATVDDHNEPRPDLVVARTEWMDESPFPIGDTLLVGEVISPSSVLRDTETKRALYAKAGVPAYWIVVPDRDKGLISLAELRLDGDTYRYATHYTTDVLTTDHPWPVTIDLPALSRRWTRRLTLALQRRREREAERGGR
jgi:Uma2 family endonuclease